MQTKRQYAIEKGLAQQGRGRMSRAAWEAIEAAKANGVKFSDSSEEKHKAKSAAIERREAKADERAKAKAERENSGVFATKPPREDRPDGYYTFENPDGTTFKRLHTSACADCSYSLQWCYCPSGPTMFIYPARPGMWEARAVMVKKPKAVITTADVPAKQPQRGGRRPRKQVA